MRLETHILKILLATDTLWLPKTVRQVLGYTTEQLLGWTVFHTICTVGSLNACKVYCTGAGMYA